MMSSIIFNDTLIHDLEEIIKYQNILLLKLICRNKNWKFKNLYNNINVNKDVINKSKFICKIKYNNKTITLNPPTLNLLES